MLTSHSNLNEIVRFSKKRGHADKTEANKQKSLIITDHILTTIC
jgi:hypothetical protein